MGKRTIDVILDRQMSLAAMLVLIVIWLLILICLGELAK